jgi:hypothetical protein
VTWLLAYSAQRFKPEIACCDSGVTGRVIEKKVDILRQEVLFSCSPSPLANCCG